ncbi:hypothetical protein RP20_CCG025529 [Aedes albopictus]|nr:uncharacterized protein LOC109404164 [Aedes albopictus]KXJ69884.1 hypothetical protein RP20_CCG025529 [Aedes albopictus]
MFIADNKSDESNIYVVCTAEGEYKIQEKPAAKARQTKETKALFKASSPMRVVCILGGFTFPISDGDEVERLEKTISERADIREEYVKLLKRKSKHIKLFQFMPSVFSDEALEGYNFNGANVLGRRKIAMKGYNIFSSCFMDAYESEGLTMEELANQITTAIKQTRNRMRQRTFRVKRSIEKMLKEKSEH